MSNTGYVTIDHEHFKKAKLEYTNWVQAIFREAIQNSVDASSTVINIDYFDSDNYNELILRFKDNGSGMDLDVLLNVLLKMGGSKKDKEGSIGGFGYAKSILFFAHNKYTIKTQNIIIEGIGGEYTYEETSEYVDGTFFEIHIEKDYYHTEIDKLEKYLNEILSFSYLPDVTFFINGEKNPFKSRTFSYDLNSDIGSIQFSDNGFDNYSYLWVRVNGLAMFEHSLYHREKSASFCGILDLNDSPLKMLTANRDSLRYEYSGSLNSIFNKLSKEREKLTYEGMFNFILNEKENIILENNNKNTKIETTDSSKLEEKTEIIDNQKALNNKNNSKITRVFKNLDQEKNKFESFFEKSISKVNQNFYPNNFVISTEKDNSLELKDYKLFLNELTKQRTIKLSFYWSIICKNILKTSILNDYITFKEDVAFIDGEVIKYGFLFGNNEILGSNSLENKTSIISINPINKYVNLDFTTILDIAIHECTHFIVKNHNESFCFQEFLLRRNIQKELKLSDIKKEISNALISLK